MRIEAMANLDSNGFEIIPNTLVEGYHSGWLENYGRVARPVSVNSTIQYRTVNVTAVAGLDYKPVSGTLVYPKGSTVAISPVPRIDIIDDNISEGEETFKYEFFNPQGSISSITYTLIISDTLRSPQAQSLEVWSNVENLTLTGSANVNGTGNQKSNTLRGNAGNNILDGKEGNDLLIGDGGSDTLIGGAGNDTYQIAPLNAAGSRIRDVSGTNDVVNISGIVEKRLTPGQIGFGRDGTTLIIDLDKDGKANLTKDLAVENFFSTGASWKAGTGFVEQIGSLSGNRVLNLFGLEGEETLTIGADDRKIKLQFVQPSTTSLPAESVLRQNWDGRNVWIVSHGWLPPSTNRQKINDLANAVAQSRPSDIVLTLDWSNAAGTIDVLNAAKWINPIAEVVANKLKAWGWGLTDGTKLNLIGHSLGSLLSTEIAARVGFAQTITALEPPSESLGLFDLDGRTPSFRERPKSFSGFSNFSRAFVGSTSPAASSEFAATADESILMQFDGIRNEHGDVVTAFTNMIRPGTPKLTSNLFSLTDNTKHSQLFKDDAFYRTLFPNIQEVSFRVYEGIIKVNGVNQPVSFMGKPPQTPDPVADPSDVILGTNGADILTGGFGNDVLTGGAGADKFVFDINTPFTSVSMGVDTIRDFANGADRIVLDKTTFKALTTAANNALSPSEFAVVNSASLGSSSTAKIVFNSTTGDLFYNQNGAVSGLGSGGRFAVLPGVTSLSAGIFEVQA